VGLSGCAAQLDALVQGSVRGNSIHVQELESAETESNRDRIPELLSRTRELHGDKRVQCDLPAKDAHHQRSRKVAILGREVCRQMRVQQFVAVSLAFTYSCQNVEGGDAWRADGL
jgi:hypothetical protein